MNGSWLSPASGRSKHSGWPAARSSTAETELVLLQGMIKFIISEGLYDREFVSSSTPVLKILSIQ